MEKCQWRIGDALLEEIPMGKEGHRTDAYAELEECAKELLGEGHDIAPDTLRSYRLVSSQFPPGRRRADVSWTSHRNAGSPEMLDAIIKVAGKKTLSRQAISDTKEIVQQHHAREWREEQRRAGVEVKPLPKGFGKRSVTPIPQKALGGLRLLGEVMRITGELEKARDIITGATEFVRENLTRLDAEDTEGFTKYAFDIVKKGHRLADVAQRLADRRRKHLSVVGG